MVLPSESTAVMVKLNCVPATWLPIVLKVKWSSGPVTVKVLLVPVFPSPTVVMASAG